MKTIEYSKVDFTGGFLKRTEDLNSDVTINAVYDRFYETGRVDAFKFDWKEGMPNKPHIFWDSDMAKWVEGAACILEKHPERKDLVDKIEALIDDIEKNQGEDGYFNIYFTVCEPENRLKFRTHHELYCAGHLFEAAVEYAKVTGRTRFLRLMEKYADYIYDVFVIRDSANFVTPGHEEIELALVKMYRYTGNKKYLDLAAFFINKRGTCEKDKPHGWNEEYSQCHIPVRQQKTAEGHSVRAVYLYTAMADLAKELKDPELLKACKLLFEDIVKRKMYITGGIGSCYVGENFSNPYDLPNEEAYTETCAGIGLIFFANRMQNLENDSVYGDIIERAFYNGVLSGLSADGESFFYENPLEISLLDHFSTANGNKRYPITQRVRCFDCSCCPPNLNRFLATLGNYVFGIEGDTLFVNQFADCTLNDGSVSCKMSADYPVSGNIRIEAFGVQKLAIRIPSWCENFSLSTKFEMKNGYAFVSAKEPVNVFFDMTPFAVGAKTSVQKDIGLLCIQRGPVVYCAEAVDNSANLHALAVSPDFKFTESYDDSTGLVNLEISGFRYSNLNEDLYFRVKNSMDTYTPVTVKMIPFKHFANRGESDMLVWMKNGKQ